MEGGPILLPSFHFTRALVLRVRFLSEIRCPRWSEELVVVVVVLELGLLLALWEVCVELLEVWVVLWMDWEGLL